MSAPGTLTATLASPHGAEGAAVVSLVGEGVLEVAGLGDVLVFKSGASGVTTLVLVSPGGGTLAFTVALADTTRLPAATVEQVAGRDDALRGDVGGYRLSWAR